VREASTLSRSDSLSIPEADAKLANGLPGRTLDPVWSDEQKSWKDGQKKERNKPARGSTKCVGVVPCACCKAGGIILWQNWRVPYQLYANSSVDKR
jgi:hypothetical protein